MAHSQAVELPLNTAPAPPTHLPTSVTVPEQGTGAGPASGCPAGPERHRERRKAGPPAPVPPPCRLEGRTCRRLPPCVPQRTPQFTSEQLLQVRTCMGRGAEGGPRGAGRHLAGDSPPAGSCPGPGGEGQPRERTAGGAGHTRTKVRLFPTAGAVPDLTRQAPVSSARGRHPSARSGSTRTRHPARGWPSPAALGGTKGSGWGPWARPSLGTLQALQAGGLQLINTDARFSYV